MQSCFETEWNETMKNVMLVVVAAVAGIVMADADVPVAKMSDMMEEIDMRNMLKMPVGKIFSVALHVADDSKLGKTSQIEIPRRYSEGAKCDALRVSHVLIDTKTKIILGAMGSNVYPTTADGNFALTNQIHAAVAEISGGKAGVYPHQFSKDRKLCWVRYVWKPAPDKEEERELYVKCFCTPKRQLCMGTLLHTVGDGIHARISDDEEPRGLTPLWSRRGLWGPHSEIRMLIFKIISGGQTGVDRGAIEAALELGFFGNIQQQLYAA